MTTRVITFRLDDESATGQIFVKWEESGYKPRQIVEMGLRMLEGLEPEPINEMSDGALSQLKEIVGRLEIVVESIEQNGGTITPQHQEQIDDVLDGRFVKGMQRLVRPGFKQKPDDSKVTYEDVDE